MNRKLRVRWFPHNTPHFDQAVVRIGCCLAALVICHFATLPLCHCSAFAADFTPQQLEFFETQVRPLLVKRCHKCHGEKKQQGHLRLDSRASILKGGDTGPAIVAGEPEESELVRAVRYDPDGYQMPPDGKLPEQEIKILTRWVEMGAPWPSENAGVAQAGDEFNLEDRAQRWSFQPLRNPRIPDASTPDAQSIRSADASWCRNPIDRFILARLRENGLTPAAPADRNTLLRRASFDVIGLPPPAEQVQAFESDPSPDAYERLIDDLLASPHFGERWGRHWLDLVRYAEGRGHEFDYDVANAHQYRDYVIRALNDDVPYDQFVVEHVAGDLLTVSEDCESASEERQSASGGLTSPARHSLRLHPLTEANESILGTGFWFLGEWVHSPVDIRADEADRFANMIDVYSKSFLGLTVACARCHDHKFDPITTKDFYALQGYLQSSHYRQARFETMEHNRRLAEESLGMGDEAMRAILPIYMRVLEQSVERLDRYLMAAFELFRTRTELRDEDALSLTDDRLGELTSPVAVKWKLESSTLTAWVQHLLTAAADENDPFHVWSQVCSGKLADITAVNEFASRQRKRMEPLDEQYTEAELRFLENAIGVWDIDCGAHLIYGSHLPLTDDPGRPYADFDNPLVRCNPLFGNLKTAADSDLEPGAIGMRRPWESAVHTGTFEIVRDKLFLNVRGNCSVYVAVDSHILIKGPLHGSLFSRHTAPAEREDEWRWLVIDVSRYKGHRAHVEVLPEDFPNFGLDAVWQSDVPPASPPEGDIYIPSGREGRLETFEELAKESVELFGWTSCLEREFIPPPNTGYSGTCAHYYGWAIEHPELFGLDLPDVTRELAAIAEPFIHKRRELMEQIKNVSATAPAMARGSKEWEPIFIRGNWKKPGELVPRQFLEVFDGGWVPSDSQHGDRFPLAKWMVDPLKTPILPRVIVNRTWQHYFGRGIVPTPDDFGHMGQEPSHPEMLDWLASELVAHDWSLKHIHRLILTSAAYRMASSESVVRGPWSVDASGDEGLSQRTTDNGQQTAKPDEIDPDNRLLHRMNVKRLEGEAIRDAILTLSGRLDERQYGKSIPVHLTPFMEGRGRPETSGPVDGAGRRSLYIAVRRNFPDPFFQAFDMPTPHTTVGRRNVSNVPAQALAMMNNPFVVEEAKRWGVRLVKEHSFADVGTRIRHAYVACLARAPSANEIAVARAYIEQQADESRTDKDNPRIWGDLCHVLLNAKEFLFVR